MSAVNRDLWVDPADSDSQGTRFFAHLLLAAVVLFVVSFIPPVFCVTVPALVVLALLMVIFAVIAALSANDGQWYRYPAAVRLIK